MRKWKALSQAFENIGSDLRHECENMEINCEIDDRFERMYILYAMLLDMLKSQRKFISTVFDEIVNEIDG